MSLRLHTHGRLTGALSDPVLGRVSFQGVAPASRADYIRVLDLPDFDADVGGYSAALTRGSPTPATLDHLRRLGVPLVHDVGSLDHLSDGDVIAVNPNGYVRTLYRVNSASNAIFATDRCNSFCLMCSQPPKPVDDADRITEHLRLIELIDTRCQELGITGGEPTLLKGHLLRIVEHCKLRLPSTALHVLSNGRLFYYGSFARDLAALDHPNLMLGIPLYSDADYDHDFVVQAKGAFHETIIGLQNLGRFGVPVEIRVVIHRLTYRRLLPLAGFIYRNFPFAAHVALMGLELMGFAVPNLDQLWIDPYDYRAELRAATRFLAARGMRVSIYNHQLCVVPADLWPYCRRSISDWKNDYLELCGDCDERTACGGFFTSGIKRRVSSHISPIRNAGPAQARSRTTSLPRA